MTTILKRTALAIATLAVLAPAWGAQGEFKIVVHPSNSLSSLNRVEVSRIFLKKTIAWPGGSPIAVVDQDRTNPTRAAFSKVVHQKDTDAIAAYWQSAVFSGRDVPPPVKHSDTEVLDFVKANPGAVGYVSASAPVAGVKVLTVE